MQVNQQPASCVRHKQIVAQLHICLLPCTRPLCAHSLLARSLTRPCALPVLLTQPPHVSEGFSRVHVVRSTEDVAALLHAWGAAAPAPAPADVPGTGAADADGGWE